jgi:hypothetical protein
VADAPFSVGDTVEVWHAKNVTQGLKGTVARIYETTCDIVAASGQVFSVAISSCFKNLKNRVYSCVKCDFPNNYKETPFICVKCQMERDMYE